MFKRLMGKKWIVAALAVMLALQVFAVPALAADDVVEVSGERGLISAAQLQEAIDGAAKWVAGSGSMSDWGKVALAGAGKSVDPSYITSLVAAGKFSYSQVTDVERAALAVYAIGGDPTNVAGVDFVDRVLNHRGMLKQGANGPIFALIMLRTIGFTADELSVWDEEKLADWIVGKQNADGGWSLVDNASSDIDVTSMSITALAPYRSGDDEGDGADTEGATSKIDKAVARGIDWISGKQAENGGFAGAWDTAESVAQAIIALSAAGIDAQSGKFAKSEGSLLSRLLDFRLSDGWFAHTPSGGSNAMATEQALMALAAYYKFTLGLGGLYDQLVEAKVPEGGKKVDLKVVRSEAASVLVRVEGPEATVVSGQAEGRTALEALESLLTSTKTIYKVQDLGFGMYVSSIGGVDGGTYGGYDGWSYVVYRGGKLDSPMVGMADYELQPGDELVVYYGGMTTVAAESVKTSPKQPLPNEPVRVKVTALAWDDEAMDMVSIPAEGVTVTIGGVSKKTNSAGVAEFAAGFAQGKHELAVSAYRDGDVPGISRIVREVGVFDQYDDQADVAFWAGASVRKAWERGLMQGLSAESFVFAPKRNMTRAEFVSSLVRLIGESPAAAEGSVYADVKAGVWYAGYVAKAKQLGLIDAEAKNFSPTREITREEAAVIIARAFGLSGTSSADTAVSDPSDLAKATSGAVPYIRAVYNNGVMVGNGGAFNPKGKLSRESAAVLVVTLDAMLNEE